MPDQCENQHENDSVDFLQDQVNRISHKMEALDKRLSQMEVILGNSESLELAPSPLFSGLESPLLYSIPSRP